MSAASSAVTLGCISDPFKPFTYDRNQAMALAEEMVTLPDPSTTNDPSSIPPGLVVAS